MSRPWAGRQLHLVGIGGSGMSALALVAQALGAAVTGSDLAESSYLRRVRAAGIRVHLGHDPARVPAGAEVVFSAAVPADDPERRVARRQLGRGFLLAQAASGRRCIAVAGTHGKTTTAAMIVHALRRSGLGADYVVGADLLGTGRHVEWGTAPILVVETDESDRSLLALAPEVAVVTSVDHDHVETFANADEVAAVFAAFAARAATTVAPVGDPDDLVLTSTGSCFRWHGHPVRLPVLGAHNARNAAAALEACVAVGGEPAACAAALADFAGVARRLQERGSTVSGARVYDDYAHHPTAVRAALTAVRTTAPTRLIAVLRPWGLRRTTHFATAYADALQVADASVVLDVGGMPGGDPRATTASARIAAPEIRHLPDAWAIQQLASTLRAGEACVAMGCADVASALIAADVRLEQGVGAT